MTTSPLAVPASTQSTWTWQGHAIAYQQQGHQGPAVVLVHGFGASLGHWRKNIPVLAQSCRVYALDLIGFGASAKPSPQQLPYTLETWGQQIADFCAEVVGEAVYLVANSIGCNASMQAAIDHPEQILGIVQLNCSLRLLHEKFKAQQPWIKRVGAPILQRLLLKPEIGQLFFNLLAKPQTLRNILSQAYGRKSAVTDELIDILLTPARDPGAVAVFTAFTNYSYGPLPQEQLRLLPCPTVFFWGAADPWEPVALAQQWQDYPQVQQFVPLAGVGHCPQDEAPEVVNPLILDWILTQSQS
jgi:pimeloyl-ACP methyl ester carboxylesterase